MNGAGDGPDPVLDSKDDRDTGLPWLQTWRGVYLFVAIVFCLWVLALMLLPVLFP